MSFVRCALCAARGVLPFSRSAVLPFLLLACELREVTIPGGEPVVVVQAVMRPDQPQQFVIVERSLDGVTERPEAGEPVPPGSPRIPVEGATVVVTNLDGRDDPCGALVLFNARPADPRYYPAPGVYWSPRGCPTMQAGDRLALQVETPAGELVTGSTVVPGMNAASLSVAGATVGFGSDTTTFNRDRDTLHVAVEAVAHRALQLEVRRAGALRKVSLLTFVDGAEVMVPGDILHLFLRGTGEDTFRGGRRYALVVGAADSNYFDFVRSRNNAITGRGFVNTLSGGIGVFGSLVVVSHVLDATADMDEPREGPYRLQGRIDTVSVDAELTVYLHRPADSTELSAFLTGTWAERVEPLTGGSYWRPVEVRAQSVDGAFDSQALMVIVATRVVAGMGASSTARLVLNGRRAVGGPFNVAVAESTGIRRIPLGSLSATQR